MKIAAVTADGTTIHAHFGQAPFYEVLTIEDGKVMGRERRAKPAHGGPHSPGEGHVHAPMMAPVIADCEILFARGMGEPAFRALEQAGIKPILVHENTIDEAVAAFLAGTLQNHPERMHRH